MVKRGSNSAQNSVFHMGLHRVGAQRVQSTMGHSGGTEGSAQCMFCPTFLLSMLEMKLGEQNFMNISCSRAYDVVSTNPTGHFYPLSKFFYEHFMYPRSMKVQEKSTF